MAIFNAGMLIAHLRKQTNLTQDQLAEGICARETITRIERGERRPDWFTFSSIMYKLGQDPEVFYSSYADKDELVVLETFLRLNKYLRDSNHRAIKLELDELKSNPLFAPPP